MGFLPAHEPVLTVFQGLAKMPASATHSPVPATTGMDEAQLLPLRGSMGLLFRSQPDSLVLQLIVLGIQKGIASDHQQHQKLLSKVQRAYARMPSCTHRCRLVGSTAGYITNAVTYASGLIELASAKLTDWMFVCAGHHTL